jgi:hypothetical protein
MALDVFSEQSDEEDLDEAKKEDADHSRSVSGGQVIPEQQFCEGVCNGDCE